MVTGRRISTRKYSRRLAGSRFFAAVSSMVRLFEISAIRAARARDSAVSACRERVQGAVASIFFGSLPSGTTMKKFGAIDSL